MCSIFEYFVLSAISLPGYQLGWLDRAKWHLALPLENHTQTGPRGGYTLWEAYICPDHSCCYTNISGSQWLDARVGAEQYGLDLDSAQPVSSTWHEMGSRGDSFDSSGSSSILQDRLCEHSMLWHQGTLHCVRLQRSSLGACSRSRLCSQGYAPIPERVRPHGPCHLRHGRQWLK